MDIAPYKDPVMFLSKVEFNHVDAHRTTADMIHKTLKTLESIKK